MVKIAAHLSAALVTGVTLTFVMAIAAHGAWGGPAASSFRTAGTASVLSGVAAALESSDPHRARGVAVYGLPAGQRAVMEIGGTHDGITYGTVLNVPITDRAADEAVKLGAIRAETRGILPLWAVREAAANVGAGPSTGVFLCYWGVGTPITKCSLTATTGNGASAGVATGAKGALFFGECFIPITPVWPGFGLSVALAGGIGWAVLYGTSLLAVRVVRRKLKAARDRYRPLPPATVACAGCGYPRKGLPSIEPCPECGQPLIIDPTRR